MPCTKCGKQLPATGTVCPYCGQVRPPMPLVAIIGFIGVVGAGCLVNAVTDDPMLGIITGVGLGLAIFGYALFKSG